MITITKVEKPASKIIEAGDIHVNCWYPIHERDERGKLLGFIRYIGGSAASSFLVILNSDFPRTVNRDEVNRALENTGGVIIDKFVNLTFDIEAEEPTTMFGNIGASRVFSLNGETWMKIDDRLAVKHGSDGKPATIGAKVHVRLLSHSCNSPLSIKYSE
ncbi:hypothetical protein MYOV003v1_p0015 [Vibrio phage 207E48.1]|nr:hypothetical protein MYOV003v1_p0015 [Vibrio phage 207E48.1]